jgi:glycerol-3-phosphate dehydrogenase
MGEVGLVRSTARERKRVFAIAPHLAERRWILVPASSYARLLTIRAGITTYEKLGAVARADRHHNWNAEDLEREEPLLRREKAEYACAYREYLTDDARLVLANLRDAVARGVVAVNHAPVVALRIEGGRATGLEARCTESGRRVEVRARCIVNAAGPWVDAVRRLEEPGAPARLHLSKGIHVGIPATRLPIRHIAVMVNSDGRTILATPRGEIVFLGTTDRSFPGDAVAEPLAERAEVESLLEPIPRYFDTPPVQAKECVTAWAGLRPLIAEPGKPPVEMSRRDEVTFGPAGVLTIAGGKLTGYRRMGAEVVESVAKALGRSLAPALEQEAPLPGGDFDGDLDRLAQRLAAATAIDSATADRLVRLYGTEAEAVVARGRERLAPGASPLAGEVAWAIEVEGAVSARDVVFRRTRAALYDPGCRALAGPVAKQMAAQLGWSPARMRDEEISVLAQLEADLSFP